MRTIHFNGERWYVNEQGALKRLRRWLIWFGGWEKANGAGWEVFQNSITKGTSLRDPTPISLLGHRFTHYGWGWSLRVTGGYLTYTKRCSATNEPALYFSQDGTPSLATIWFFGAPPQVERAARERRSCPDYPNNNHAPS